MQCLRGPKISKSCNTFGHNSYHIDFIFDTYQVGSIEDSKESEEPLYNGLILVVSMKIHVCQQILMHFGHVACCMYL